MPFLPRFSLPCSHIATLKYTHFVLVAPNTNSTNKVFKYCFPYLIREPFSLVISLFPEQKRDKNKIYGIHEP